MAVTGVAVWCYEGGRHLNRLEGYCGASSVACNPELPGSGAISGSGSGSGSG